MTMEVALLGTSTDVPSFNNDSRVKRLVQIDGQLLALQRIWDTGTLAYRTVTDGDMGGGGGGGDATAANQVTQTARLQTLIDSLANNRMKTINAVDCVETYSYLDAGADDERFNTIVYTSASLATTITVTFGYNGASPYRITSKTWS